MMRTVEAHSCRRHTPPDRSSAPFFRALDALAVDDRRGRAGLAPGLFAALDIERMMDAI